MSDQGSGRSGVRSSAALDAIRQRAEQATKGPWSVVGPCEHIYAENPYRHGRMFIAEPRGWGHLTGTGACHFSEEKALKIQGANAAFIAHARQDVPDLLDLVASLQQRITELEQEKTAILAHIHAPEWTEETRRTMLFGIEPGESWTETIAGVIGNLVCKTVNLREQIEAGERRAEAAEQRLAQVEAERDEARRTVKSVTVMLGWLNDVPRDTIEAHLRALRARDQQQSATLARCQALSEQYKAALEKIADPANDADPCGCEHEDDSCCALHETGYHCPLCIAARALSGAAGLG